MQVIFFSVHFKRYLTILSRIGPCRENSIITWQRRHIIGMKCKCNKTSRCCWCNIVLVHTNDMWLNCQLLYICHMTCSDTNNIHYQCQLKLLKLLIQYSSSQLLRHGRLKHTRIIKTFCHLSYVNVFINHNYNY